MAMPSYPSLYEYSQNPAEVPGDLLDLQDLEYWSLVEDSASRRQLKPNGQVPVLKAEPEPDFLPDYLESTLPPTSWYPDVHHHQVHAPHSFVSMEASNYQQTSPSNQQVQLTISEPPTPAAECQVTSTNFSPLPQSPYSPHSEASYDGREGFEAGFMDDSVLSLSDLEDINLKGLTEEQLVSLSARDLNRICRDMPEDLIKQLKKRRRTLKNRGYAYNSRIRRVTQKNSLEIERDDLKKQLDQLTERYSLLQKESEQWKKRAQALEAGNL
jgi:hypothetical protein